MSKHAKLTAVVALIGLALVGCNLLPNGLGQQGSSKSALQALVKELQGRGAKVTLGETIVHGFIPVSGREIIVDGNSVQVFEFANAAAAKRAAGTIPPDGSTFQTMIIDWIAPPHFFQKGSLIVLYVGMDPELLAELRALLGPPFAGLANELDVDTILSALRAAGLAAQLSSTEPHSHFSAPGQVILAGGQRVEVFQYDTGELARAEADSLKEELLFWADAPHLYLLGSTVVLYVGNEEKILDALESLLGQPHWEL